MPHRSVSRSEGVVNQPPRQLVRRLLFRTLPVAASLGLLACTDVDPTLNSSGIKVTLSQQDGHVVKLVDGTGRQLAGRPTDSLGLWTLDIGGDSARHTLAASQAKLFTINRKGGRHTRAGMARVPGASRAIGRDRAGEPAQRQHHSVEHRPERHGHRVRGAGALPAPHRHHGGRRRRIGGAVLDGPAYAATAHDAGRHRRQGQAARIRLSRCHLDADGGPVAPGARRHVLRGRRYGSLSQEFFALGRRWRRQHRVCHGACAQRSGQEQQLRALVPCDRGCGAWRLAERRGALSRVGYEAVLGTRKPSALGYHAQVDDRCRRVGVEPRTFRCGARTRGGPAEGCRAAGECVLALVAPRPLRHELPRLHPAT